ncbi:MAG: NAD(P)-dependent oxidoreductase [Pseudomonadota bacterium]
MTRHILLTGGTGYLGAHIARDLLSRGENITILTRPSSQRDTIDRILAEDVDQTALTLTVAPATRELAEWVMSIAPDAIIHTAASGGAVHTPADIPDLISANVTLGTTLLEAATLLRNKDGRARPMVYCGSFWQHASGTDALIANSLYAAAKSAFEVIAEYYRQSHDARVVGIKFFDIYGPKDSRKRVIDLLLDATFAETAQPFSKGEQIIAPIYVDDAVHAIMHVLSLLDTDHAGALTYAADGPLRLNLRELADLVADVTGCPPKVDWGALPYRDQQIFTPAQLPRPPGWAPKVSLRSGIEKLIAARANPRI